MSGNFAEQVRLLEHIILPSLIAGCLALGGWQLKTAVQVSVIETKVERHEQLMPDVAKLGDAVETLRREQQTAYKHIRETIDLRSKNLELLIETKLSKP